MYLQRLYLEFSVLDRDPVDLFISCIYLACKVSPRTPAAQALKAAYPVGAHAHDAQCMSSARSLVEQPGATCSNMSSVCNRLPCMCLQVEEHYMSAEALAKGFGQADEQDVLGNESTLLIALRFDLITYPPYRPLEGFLQVPAHELRPLTCMSLRLCQSSSAWYVRHQDDMRMGGTKHARDMSSAVTSHLGSSACLPHMASSSSPRPCMQDLADAQPAGDAANGVGGSHAPPVRVSPEQLQQARQHAMEAADVLLLTDAPLLFPPAQLALSALRSGLRKVTYMRTGGLPLHYCSPQPGGPNVALYHMCNFSYYHMHYRLWHGALKSSEAASGSACVIWSLADRCRLAAGVTRAII